MHNVMADSGASEAKPVHTPFWKTRVYAVLKPYIYMAAMFGGLYFGIWVYKYQQRLMSEKADTTLLSKDNGASSSDESTEDVDTYVNEACDYMMTDSHDIVACLTDSDN